MNLIDEVQTYDPDKKVRDHATDGTRYGLMGAVLVGGEATFAFGGGRGRYGSPLEVPRSRW